MNPLITLVALAFAQNVSFSLVSRARNRDNFSYHATAATLSNLIWFATMHHLVATELSWAVLPAYLLGTVTGSLSGAWISIRIERLIGAKA